ASFTFAEERKPTWLRPQPQPQPLVAEVSGAPTRLFLEQNYPNPFNPSTMIRYGVPNTMRVKLTVHTLLGSQIRVLVDQWQDTGTYTFDFVAADLPSGAYFYRLQTDVGTITRRMIISK
ncbi:MAG: T9SS type A sorting domain-containing protein, partial [bacterium]|nr:T9SS type A sorting domain-containing protein [Candidatus Kapabacteria bacterium]